MRRFLKATLAAGFCLASAATSAVANDGEDNWSAAKARADFAAYERRSTPAQPRVARAAPRRETVEVEAAPRRRATRSNSGRYEVASLGSAPVAYSGGSSGGGSVGIASYYWQPQRVASGGWFNPNAMTAAHRTLPFGTRVRVTHLGNGRSVDVTINDRGPFIAGRIIDLSKAAAGAINMQGQGLAQVRVEVLGR
jgi:rare lipoprotein A